MVSCQPREISHLWPRVVKPGGKGSAYANASVGERVALRVLLRMWEWQ